jgi:hypothetical protein
VNLHVDVGPRHGASIHFGVRVPPPVVRVPPPASVHYEHYERREHIEHHPEPHWGAPPYAPVYRHPYRDDYLRRFRPGYRTIVVGNTLYYTYPGLPPAYRPVVVSGVTYYFADGVYYQPYLYGGQTVYMVVPPPVQ